jgi:ATP-dependent Clp protease ATP-binding subunit ClpB
MTQPMRVTVDVVAKAVSDATGLPVDKLKSTEQEKVLNLDVVLAEEVRSLNLLYGHMLVPDIFEEVVGQPEATKAVADAIRLAYSGLTSPGRPVASFLLVGPTGTGKTMLAKTVRQLNYH